MVTNADPRQEKRNDDSATNALTSLARLLARQAAREALDDLPGEATANCDANLADPVKAEAAPTANPDATSPKKNLPEIK